MLYEGCVSASFCPLWVTNAALNISVQVLHGRTFSVWGNLPVSEWPGHMVEACRFAGVAAACYGPISSV